MKNREKYVDEITKFLEKKWKRNLCWREANGTKGFFHIYDPVFLDIQRASNQGNGRYSSGINIYFFKSGGIDFGFRTYHASAMLENFKKSITAESLIVNLRKIFRPNTSVYVEWSSKKIANETNKKHHENYINADSWSEFKKGLYSEFTKESFFNDIGSNAVSTYISRNKKNKFTQPKVNPRSLFGVNYTYDYQLSVSEVKKLLLKFEPFFMSLYPNVPRKNRSDNLRGKLNTAYKKYGLPKICAYKRCKEHKNLEAAHIKPYRSGGGDDPSNGVFLCHQHHYFHQEGKSFSEQKKMLKKQYIEHTRLAS